MDIGNWENIKSKNNIRKPHVLILKHYKFKANFDLRASSGVSKLVLVLKSSALLVRFLRAACLTQEHLNN